MGGYFLHKNLLIRFFSLYIFSALLCAVVWGLSYRFLPEGFLRGGTGAAVLSGKDVPGYGFLQEFGKLFLLNLLLSVIPIVASSLYLSYSGYPLGWIVVPFRALYFGLLLGTNSFNIPLPGGKPAPTMEIFLHAGPYEIASYALIAAAVCFLSRYDIRRIPPEGKWGSVDRKNGLRIPREAWLGILIGISILAVSSAVEAYQILHSI